MTTEPTTCTCDTILHANRRIEVRGAPWLATQRYRRRLLARVFYAYTHKGKVEIYARVEYDTPSGTRNSVDAEDWERWAERAAPMPTGQVEVMLADRRRKRWMRR